MSIPSQRRTSVARGLAWFSVTLLTITPLFSIATITVLRSGLLNLHKGLTDEQFKALWTFMGAGVAASATILGALLTASHNKRTLAIQKDADNRRQILESEAAERLKVDTAISGLTLISQNGKYAPKASIAGGLASLVHLGHPNIAMRALGAALTDDVVDGDTAAWLLVLQPQSPDAAVRDLRLYLRHSDFRTERHPADQRLRGTQIETAAVVLGQILISDVTTGTAEDLVRAKREAAAMLRSYAPRLTYSNLSGAYGWPNCVQGEWPRGLHPEAESNLVKAVVRLLVSQEIDWWRDPTWVVRTLDEAATHSQDATIRSEAASYALRILKTIRSDQILGIKTPTPTSEIRLRLEKIPPISLNPMVLKEIEAWEQEDTSRSSTVGDQPIANTMHLDAGS